MTVALSREEQFNKKGFLPIVMIFAIILGVGLFSSTVNASLKSRHCLSNATVMDIVPAHGRNVTVKLNTGETKTVSTDFRKYEIGATYCTAYSGVNLSKTKDILFGLKQ